MVVTNPLRELRVTEVSSNTKLPAPFCSNVMTVPVGNATDASAGITTSTSTALEILKYFP